MPNKRKLSYERQNNELDLKPKANELTLPVEKNRVTFLSVSHQLKGYEKTDGVMSYSIICVISGGEKRERDFLKTLIRQELHSLRVAFITKEGQGQQPYQMQERWKEIQRSKNLVLSDRTFQLDEMDKVFLLSDVDEFYEQLVKIMENRNEKDSGQWIISNPCFEMWLYYCFCDNPQEDLAGIAFLEPKKRSQKMKKLGHLVIAGGLNPIKAFEHMQEGIDHSSSHYAEDDKAIPVLYATQMYKMAQFLIDTMNSNRGEYDEFVKQKQQWRINMKKSCLDKPIQKQC